MRQARENILIFTLCSSREKQKHADFLAFLLFFPWKRLLLLMLLLLYHIFSLNAHGSFFFCYERIACNFSTFIASTVHVKWYTLHCFHFSVPCWAQNEKIKNSWIFNECLCCFCSTIFTFWLSMLCLHTFDCALESIQDTRRYFVLKSSSSFRQTLVDEIEQY